MDLVTQPSNEIRQGFICPVCMKDIGDADRLQEHVDSHSTPSDDDPLDYLKGIFDFFPKINFFRSFRKSKAKNV